MSHFDPSAIECLRFTARTLSPRGAVELHYALDDRHAFVERIDLPAPPDPTRAGRGRVQALLDLLHWAAGVSYFKLAAPAAVACEAATPGPAAAALMEALYSEGLGEFAVVNDLPDLPRPRFPARAPAPAPAVPADEPGRVLVPVGGGKDSVVALEIARRSPVEVALFSVGDATPIARTAAVATLPRLIARRRIDPAIGELNRSGALNGHVPITGIVSLIAALTAELHGFDAVALANERSASAANLEWRGTPVNHQFSKGRRAELLLEDAVREAAGGPRVFSLLRPASELAIARAFSSMPEYHAAFTSCNRVFRLDPELRSASWCADCDKCRFVYLILAPFLDPPALTAIFGRDMLADPSQYGGFALLTGTGGHKPFECVGEVEESVAAIRLLASRPRWAEHAVVRRLVDEVLPRFAAGAGDPAAVLTLSDDHSVPERLIPQVRALLGP